MNKQIRVFQIKEIHHKQRAKSYAQQIEDGFLIHHQNYQSAYKGQVGPSETPVTVRGRLEEQRPNTFIGRPFGVSDVMVWDEEEKRKFFYVDADYVAGVVDSEDYQLIREDYSKQYDGLRAALQRAEAKKVEVEQQIREYLNMTSNLEEHLDDFGFDAQLVKSLVQRIEVSADKRIRIVFGFQDVFADLGKESAGK